MSLTISTGGASAGVISSQPFASQQKDRHISAGA